MAIQIKRIQTGTFSSSDVDNPKAKTLVRCQLGYERSTDSLVFNDEGGGPEKV